MGRLKTSLQSMSLGRQPSRRKKPFSHCVRRLCMSLNNKNINIVTDRQTQSTIWTLELLNMTLCGIVDGKDQGFEWSFSAVCLSLCAHFIVWLIGAQNAQGGLS